MGYRILLAVVALLVLTSARTFGQASPTTQEAADVLKTQGLTRSGLVYLLEADLKLEENLRPVRKAQVALTRSRKARADIEQDIERAENSARQWAREAADINRQMSGTRNTRKYNELVGEMNLRTEWIKQADQVAKQREQDLGKTSESPDDYVALVMELSDKMEAAAKEYEALAANKQVQEALASLNEGSAAKVKLGPSLQFTQELPRRRKERATIDSAVIKLAGGHGVPQVEVKLNGTLTQMMVVDSGASIVTITSEVARQLGISPGAADRTVTLGVADGKELEARIVRLQSIRLAQFTVEDVECAVLPASADGAPCLLGGTFLRHFAYRMDLGAGALHMSQIHDPARKTRGRPATTRPAIASKATRRPQAND